MPAGDRAAQRTRFLDREHRRMSDGLVLDAELIQIGEKRVGRGRHFPVNRAARAWLQSGKLFGIACRGGSHEMAALPFSDAGVAQG